MIEKIDNKGCNYAIIIRNNYSQDGVQFFTSDESSQQLAFMKHPKNKTISPHIHNIVLREINLTNEVLFIKKGKLRVDFFDSDRKYFESKILNAGDVILLIEGGHGFKVIEDVEMIEVKQGPYVGEADKVRFVNDINDSEIFFV